MALGTDGSRGGMAPEVLVMGSVRPWGKPGRNSWD